MKNKNLSSLKDTFQLNPNLIGIFISLFIFVCIYWYAKDNSRKINYSEYTEEVELVTLDFEKTFINEGFYTTKVKLDKILFELNYKFEDQLYHSNSVLYWEQITPKLLMALDKNELHKIKLMCKSNNPKDVAVMLNNK